MKTSEVLIYTVTALIGGASLLIPFILPGILSGAPTQEYSFFGFAFSILTLLIGDRIAAAQREHAATDALHKSISEILQKLPNASYLREFSSASEAMLYISHNLVRCKTVLNTRMAPEVIEAHPAARSSFLRAMKAGIAAGIRWKDVFSAQFRDWGQRFSNEIQDATGSYHFFIVECQVPVINFTILDYGNENKEVVFGWAMSRFYQDERPAFVSYDQRLVRFFEHLHEYLVASSEK